MEKKRVGVVEERRYWKEMVEGWILEELDYVVDEDVKTRKM